jgi:polyisoprenoid-binding protein YceI
MSLLVQCSEDEGDIVKDETPNIVRGTDIILSTDCTPSDYFEGLLNATDNGAIFAAYGLIPAQQWFLDIPHSGVNWKTKFNGTGANLTGKFRYFQLKNISFDETKPEDISFEANVLLNSVSTGEPIRDAGCLLGTFATASTNVFEAANLASIKTLSAAYNTEDNGYTVDAELTFLGSTRSITIYLYYLGQTSVDGGKYASFTAEFDFNAISDYGLNSTSVDDLVTVTLNINLKMTD